MYVKIIRAVEEVEYTADDWYLTDSTDPSLTETREEVAKILNTEFAYYVNDTDEGGNNYCRDGVREGMINILNLYTAYLAEDWIGSRHFLDSLLDKVYQDAY